MTGGHNDIDIPFELTDEDRAEFRGRWCKKCAARVGPLVAIELVLGIAIRGLFGGVLIGIGIMLVAMIIGQWRLVTRQLLATTAGSLSERSLVVRDGEVLILTPASTTRLNQLSVKSVVDRDRLVYFESPWGQWSPIPRHVLDQPGVRPAVISAVEATMPIGESPS